VTRARRGLTVAVTGPTGTFGSGLMPLLQDDDRIARVIGIARRPFDPAERGWSKMTYRRGDVRDLDTLREAFDGVDVVVHLAFLITGNASRETTQSINVDGTLNVFRAAADVGAQRFVYASSVAAYGFGTDIPEPIDDANGRRALRTWLRRYMSTQVDEMAMIRVWIDTTRDHDLVAGSAPLLDWGRRRMARFLRGRGFGDGPTEAIVLLSLVAGLSPRHRADTVVGPALSIIERGFLGRLTATIDEGGWT
jgi:hypothetical protein